MMNIKICFYIGAVRGMKINELRRVLENLKIDEYEYFILDSGKGPWAEVYVSL